MAADKALLQLKHPDYVKFQGEWQFFWQSFEGGQEYIRGGTQILDSDVLPASGTISTSNLIRHKRETDVTYKARMARAFYLNYCGAIIDTYISHLNKEAPLVDAKSVGNWDRFAEDVNRRGDSLNEFRHDMQAAAMALGHCFILVDKPKGLAESAADEIERGLLPFYTLYYPWDVWDWQLDRFGEPYWVKIVEKDDKRINPTQMDSVNKRSGRKFKIWTREMWTAYDEQGLLIDAGEHGLGRVPLVPVYNRKRQRSRYLGISAINDIAYVNRRIFNLGSLIDQFAYNACFPMLANPVQMGENQSTVQVSETLVWDYPDVAHHPPSWMSPPTEPMEFLAGEIETSEQKIYRLARLEAGFEARAKQPASGISKAFDWMETSTVLSQKADNFEEAETRAAKLWLDWMDIRRGEIIVDYPDSFDVRTLEKDLEDATELSTLFISEKLMERVFNRLVDKIDPKIDDTERAVIREQIRKSVEATFAEHNFAATLTNDIEDIPSNP